MLSENMKTKIKISYLIFFFYLPLDVQKLSIVKQME